MAPTGYTRIAAVTGANKGIGLAIVRQLALTYPSSAFNNGPLLIYLTARNAERGAAAVDALTSDPTLHRAKALHGQGGPSEVKYVQLDVDDADSIERFTARLRADHPDGIDLLINNAGVALEGFDADVVRRTLRCNYTGTLLLTRALLPLMRQGAGPGGRIVHVASSAGVLSSRYAPAIRRRFVEANATDEISELMREFVSAVERDEHSSTWPGSAYAVSKAGMIGMTKTMTREQKGPGGNADVLINACCPGYVNTDMTKGRGVKTVEQGARTPVLLALGDIGGVSGEFWRDEKVIPWETG